ncbi:MAG: hypothetical protein PVS3B1_25770 [Ktedonobacteraceae bacterium]
MDRLTSSRLREAPDFIGAQTGSAGGTGAHHAPKRSGSKLAWVGGTEGEMEKVTPRGFRGEHGGEWKVRTRCALGEHGRRGDAKLVQYTST